MMGLWYKIFNWPLFSRAAKALRSEARGSKCRILRVGKENSHPALRHEVPYRFLLIVLFEVALSSDSETAQSYLLGLQTPWAYPK